MRALFYSLLGYFLTPAGVVAMAALDASVVFFMPLGIDVVVIIMAARRPEWFWVYTVLATAGSIAGTGVTFWLGRKLGEHGLSRLVKPSRLERVEARVTKSAAVSVAALAVIPPPFPFTAFVLTSGALNVNAWRFFTMLGAMRLMRFAVEGWLASRYGRGILTWMESTTFEIVIGVLIALAVIGTAVSAVAVVRGTRSSGGAQTRHSRRAGTL